MRLSSCFECRNVACAMHMSAYACDCGAYSPNKYAGVDI
jgi:hypothetical protein